MRNTVPELVNIPSYRQAVLGRPVIYFGAVLLGILTAFVIVYGR